MILFTLLTTLLLPHPVQAQVSDDNPVALFIGRYELQTAAETGKLKCAGKYKIELIQESLRVLQEDLSSCARCTDEELALAGAEVFKHFNQGTKTTPITESDQKVTIESTSSTVPNCVKKSEKRVFQYTSSDAETNSDIDHRTVSICRDSQGNLTFHKKIWSESDPAWHGEATCLYRPLAQKKR